MRISLAFVLTGLVACGGSTPAPEAPTGGTGSGAKPSSPGDVSFDVQPIEVKGVMFEPEALGSPGMPLVEAKKKTTLEKQRQVYEKTKDPVQKEAQAAVLATMLYQASKTAKGDEQKKLQADARQVLRDAAANSGDKVDEITLRLLGSYELMLEDYPAAEKAWGGLVTKAPKDKDVLTNKAWWAYSLLKQYKNAEALAVVKDEALSEKTPELAYVAAWAKWRTGDDAGAWNAIVTAAKGWAGMPGRDALDRDLLLFAGRTNTSLPDAVTALTPFYGKNVDQQYDMLAKLGLQSYQYAGRWADGVAALEKAVQTVGAKVPVNDLPVIRYEQAEYTVRLDDPQTAAKFATQAIEALPACGAKCSAKDMETIVMSVYSMARLFHNLYATAHDDRYYQPAHDLYQLTLPKITNDNSRKEAQQAADFLERSFKSMRAGVGTHEKQTIGALLNRHNQEAQACYEHALSSNPKLAGSVVVNLESDQTGAIKGVSTEPKAGLADLSAVAGCIAEQAKAWKLPKRAQAGSTRIKLTYAVSPAKS
ncbi:MAG: AgmX/PglI C-terminal domain-containing protein [Kofleriaceae bacterium]|nr:AgmX/PglI C-terminal domain-containing protein [Kofleriaceae bacterium]